MVIEDGPLLEGEGIVRRFGRRVVLDIERVAVQRGEVLAIVGPNGAGKSTLFRTLLLLEAPDAGMVRLGGTPMRQGDPRARGRLAGVFQRPVLFSGTVHANVGFGLAALGVSRPERARRTADALAWMRLEALRNAPVHTLSGGEAQRVALARALVLQPDVLLLDEPTANLDIAIRREFLRDVEEVARGRAQAIILITHDPGEAFGLADRIAVLHDGRIVQTGTPDDLALRPATPFIAALTGAELLLHGAVETVDDGLVAIRVSRHILLWGVPHGSGTFSTGADAVVAYRPEDITISTAPVSDTSAINHMAATVQAVVPAGPLMRIRLRADGILLTALVTRRSVDALRLAADSPVQLHLKAAALQAWRRDTQRADTQR